MTKLFFFLLIFSSLGLAQFAPTPTQTGGGGGAASSVPIGGVQGNAAGAAQGPLTSNKLRDHPSVLDTAADPSGVLDSTSAIQGLITAQSGSLGAQIYIPCGTYKISSSAGNAALTVVNATMSFEGAGLGCVTFDYVGSGTAIAWLLPGSFIASGTIGGFTVVGNSSAQIGIRTTAISGLKMHDIVVQQFGAGDGIQLADAPPGDNWTERNLFQNIQVNYNLKGFHLLVTGTNDSFGYNDFIGIRANADIGETAFFVDSGASLYNGSLDLSCNMSNDFTGSGNVTCLGVSGNIGYETVKVTGEVQNFGTGTATYCSVHTYTGGQIISNGPAPQIVNAPVCNDNAASYFATSRFAPTYSALDTGTFTLNGVPTTPTPYSQNSTGLCGELSGTNIASPFCSMYNFAGNEFVVGVQNYGQPIGSMTPVWDVDISGNTTNTGNSSIGGGYYSGGSPIAQTVTGSVTAGTQYAISIGVRLTGLYEVSNSYAGGVCYALFTAQGSQYSNGVINMLANSCGSGTNGPFGIYLSSGGGAIILSYTPYNTGTVTVTNYGLNANLIQVSAFPSGATNVTSFQNYIGAGPFQPSGLGLGTTSIGTSVGVENALGHWGSHGTAPTIGGTGCAASGTVNDNDGAITLSTGATSCTVTFSAAFANPIPQLTASSTTILPVISNVTTTVLTIGVSAASGKVYYHVRDVN